MAKYYKFVLGITSYDVNLDNMCYMEDRGDKLVFYATCSHQIIITSEVAQYHNRDLDYYRQRWELIKQYHQGIIQEVPPP